MEGAVTAPLKDASKGAPNDRGEKARIGLTHDLLTDPLEKNTFGHGHELGLDSTARCIEVRSMVLKLQELNNFRILPGKNADLPPELAKHHPQGLAELDAFDERACQCLLVMLVEFV